VTTDNLIIIKGGAYNDIKKALRQWIDQYLKDLPEGLTFQIFKNRRGNHIIQADKRLDNERFFYLVNYLKYPEDIEYKIEIEGYTTGKDKNQLKDKDLLVYISSTDKEYDNVFVATSENENFKIDFGGKITEIIENKIFNYPTDLILEYPETIKINRKAIVQKEEEINQNRLEKRFKILSIITFSLSIIGLIVNLFDPEIFREFSFFLGLGIGLWFFGDYKMLQSNKLYLYCLGIATGYLLFILALNGEFNKGILDFGALYPITLLIVQKPTRILYKTIFNSEPEVDRSPKSYWDIPYMMILFFALAALPFIIMDILMK
jgi:hypothetical protein